LSYTRLRPNAVVAVAGIAVIVFCVYLSCRFFIPVGHTQPGVPAGPPQLKHFTAETQASDEAGVKWARELVQKQMAPPTVNELSEIWEESDSAYCDALRRQSDVEMLVNLADANLEWMSIQNGEVFWDENLDIVKLLLRTRRFNQAVMAVLERDEAGRQILADKMVSAIGQLHEMLQSIEEKGLAEANSHTDERYQRMWKLRMGDRQAPQFTPERYGSNGAAVGMAANACLLGLCGDVKHLSTLMTIARPVEITVGYGAKFAAIDAMDRILCRQQSNTSLNPDGQATVSEYTAWRERRQLPKRETVPTFAYDSPGTPYDLSGQIANQPTQVQPDFELPYAPAAYPGYGKHIEKGILDSTEKLREYNNEVNAMGDPAFARQEDPGRGLTIEDTHYIMAQAQRLVELTASR